MEETNKPRDVILEALIVAKNRQHDYRTDYGEVACSEEEGFCIFCQAIQLHQSNRKLFFHDDHCLRCGQELEANGQCFCGARPMNTEQRDGRVKRSTLTIGESEKVLKCEK